MSEGTAELRGSVLSVANGAPGRVFCSRARRPQRVMRSTNLCPPKHPASDLSVLRDSASASRRPCRRGRDSYNTGLVVPHARHSRSLTK